jgi:ribosomal protein L37AE/L43A
MQNSEELNKNAEKIIDSTAIDHQCPNCGKKIEFKPSSGKWECENCKSVFTLEELKKKSGNAATDIKNDDKNLVEDDDTTYILYNCPDCGAEIITDEQTSATFCVYCGNTAILKNKLAGKFKPDYIIPFKKTKEEAEIEFTNISKGRMFVPKTFNNKNNIEKIRGVYIPFWMYDVDFNGTMEVKGTNVTHWTVGRTHYTKTDIYDVHRKGNMLFEKIPVDGSTRFENSLMNSIEPFDYKDLVPYNHAYLSGFLAEKYDVDEGKSYEDAKTRAISTAEDRLLFSCKYPSKKIISKNYDDTITKISYVLLPVYMVNVKYNNKYYTFAMNGQTGKFIGNIPLNKKKVVIVTIIMLIVLFGIMELCIYLAYLGGIK